MRYLLIVLFCLSYLFSNDPTIEIVKNVSSVSKITIKSKTTESGLNRLDLKLKKMLEADLKLTGYFLVGDESQKSGSSYILEYELFKIDSKIKANFRVLDLASLSTVFTKEYLISKQETYPFISHRVVSDFSKSIGIDSVDWINKYVLFSRLISPGESEILISDYSLTYMKTVVKGGVNIFPKWSSANQDSFYYTELLDKPTLFKVDISSGKKTKILDSNGMLVCSDISNDGEKLLLTLGDDEQPDIYEYNLKTKSKRRLTFYKGIDVNGNYIEDDSGIVFVSDRLGRPEIFTRNKAKSGVEQLIFKGEGNNYINSWGNYILFVSRDSNSEFGSNTFNIYLASTKTEYIRQLTTTGYNHFPRFSDSGDTVLYIKEYKNDSALGVIRLQHNKSFLFPIDIGKIHSIDW